MLRKSESHKWGKPDRQNTLYPNREFFFSEYIFAANSILTFIYNSMNSNSFNSLTLQNGKTHSNSSSAVADELFQCVWPFFGVGA